MTILQSIKPQYCELIASGKKTIEVRKTRPKIQTPFKVYIYCTKDKTPFLLPTYSKGNLTDSDIWQNANGKVIGEYVCDEIIEWTEDMRPPVPLDKIQLSYPEIRKYGGDKTLYLWHISDLVIYDKPKELCEFYRKCDQLHCETCKHLKWQRVNADEFEYDCEYYAGLIPLTRPPQSWCYVEEVTK